MGPRQPVVRLQVARVQRNGLAVGRRRRVARPGRAECAPRSASATSRRGAASCPNSRCGRTSCWEPSPATTGAAGFPTCASTSFPISPTIWTRRAGQLSGGQQQQLSISRALATDPKILLLDEPIEGIQPNIVQEIEATIVRLNTEVGLTLVLTEQHIRVARALAHEFVIMDNGLIVEGGPIDALTDAVVDKYLTI